MDFSSDTLLLSTKLKIPAPRKNYVVRKALFEKLSKCADMSVVFVRGGAGMGKTTLMSSFIREKGLKNVCWLSLDASNSNICSFWMYFTAAVSPFLEDGGELLSLVRSNPDTAHIENLLVMLINGLCGEEDFYIVLDDVHYLTDPALIKTFDFFIGAMPQNFHFFMLSREDPPVYLGPLAVSGRLLFIDGKQMALSPEEGLIFLRNTLGLKSSDEELLKLTSFAEGWIGGLQLAAAAGCGSSELLRAGGGIAAEYLTRELIAKLTADERAFLIRTGFLSYFDFEICSVMLENLTKTDFDRMIDTLISKNLFIICIDESAGVFRYHNILSEYLCQQFSLLPEGEKKGLYLKAASAFEKRGDFEEALREYLEVEDYDNILRLAKSLGGRIETWSYLEKVPADLLIRSVDLAAQCFMYDIGILNVEHGRLLYDKLKEHYGDTDAFRVLQFAETYVSTNKKVLPQYYELSAEQIEHFDFGPAAKAMILVQNSVALLNRMRYEESENSVKKAIEISTGLNAFILLLAYNQLGQFYEEVGRLNDALDCYEKSFQQVSSPLMLSGSGFNYYIGIAGVYMGRMELDRASDVLNKTSLLLENQHINVDVTTMTLRYHLAELEILRGNCETGKKLIEELIADYSCFSLLTMTRLIHELDCANLLSPEIGDAFLRELDEEEEFKSQPFLRLMRARLLLGRGKASEALKETDDVLAFTRLHKNSLRLVQADILKIYLLKHSTEKPGQSREITNLLREAIHYAHLNRILMPFYLERETLLPLMRELKTAALGPLALALDEEKFLRDAISVCENPYAVSSKEPEILSTRELEVLGELALGITNREIADKLCISQATVKTHILSIFGKLGVSSRMAAADTGRKLGLIN